MLYFVNKCIFSPAKYALIHHFRNAALDTKNQIQYNQGSKPRKEAYIEMLLSYFQLSLAICNVWPKRMSLKAFLALYILLLLAGMPVTLLSCIPYGLFGILAAACIYGLVICRDTAPQNVCMGMVGLVLAIVTGNFLSIFFRMLVPADISDHPYISFGVDIIYLLLFYFITLLCGRLLKKISLSDKGILRLPQTWYLIEAALEEEQPRIGLNIIQNETGVSIIISNCCRDNGQALHRLKQKGFSTKTGHQGIGLSNARKIINSYDNVLLETTMQCGCFIQHMELVSGKE